MAERLTAALLKIAHMAACRNMQASPHFAMELHLPLAAAIPNSLFVEYIPSLNPVLTEPLNIVGGCFVSSEGPGVGIPFDWDRLTAFEAKIEN